MKLLKIKKKIKISMEKCSLDELIILGLTVSILLSVYFTIAATVLTLTYLIMQKKIKTLLKTIKGAYLAIAFCLLSLIVSFYYGNFTGMILAVAMFLISIIGMYVRLAMTRALFEKMVDLTIHISILCFLVALFQQFFAGLDSSYRADSTFLNANYYATYIEFVILFCVYKLMENPSRRKKLYFLTVIFINICGLYLCDCRTAFIVLGFTIPVMLILYGKYKAFGIMVGISAAAIASLLLFPNLFPRGNYLNSDLSIRLSIWKTAIKGILQNPLFGQGSGTYGRIYAIFNGHPAPHAHNIILDPLLNFGIIGSGLLLFYIKEHITSIYKMYTGNIANHKFNLAFAIILCVLLHGLFDAAIFGIQTGFLFLLFLSMAGITENHQIFHNVSMEDLQALMANKISRFPNIKKFFLK